MGRFASLVKTPNAREVFKAKYNILAGISITYYELGEWYTKRRTRKIVTPMIAFIEGGMRIPIGKVTSDFLTFFRLCPTQCSPNLFWVIGSIDSLNDKIDVNLTHHDVNWVYSCQGSKDIGYYLKTKVPIIRLISCLPEINKGMDKDFLIISGDWC